jgi:hypothetical protein
MQHREEIVEARSPLEALLARTDEPATTYLSERLTTNGVVDVGEVPPPPEADATSDPHLSEGVQVEG